LKNENSNRKNTKLPTSQRKKIKEEQKLDINHYKRRQRANSAEKWGKKIVACVVLFSIFFFYKPYGKSRWGKWGKTDDLPLK